MDSKKVGVIIPIYNAQKYLKECLESVINQSYENLEVLLIDDGSCDESVEIAREYVRRDSRLMLFIKDNGGQASARNVGIEYFTKSYELEVLGSEESLWHYRIKGENVYAIKAILKNHPIDSIPSIDYLIFLDSDDYWALECVEECVKKMEGVEIVWLDYKRKYEGGCREGEKPTEVEKCGFNEGKITPKEFLQRSYEVSKKWCVFTWQGMIDFKYLKSIHLRFLDTLVEEDHHFWILLLIQSRLMFILPHKLYFYRIRLYSMTNYGGKTSIKGIPARLKPYLKDFRGNPMLLQKYCLAGSAAIMLADIFQRMEKGLENNICVFLKEKILKRLCMLAMNLESFQSDPMGFLPLLKSIKPYAREYKIGAYALVHKSLEYQLGLAIISSFKSFSNFLYSPLVIISVFKHYQRLSLLQSQISQPMIPTPKPHNPHTCNSSPYNPKPNNPRIICNPKPHNLQFQPLQPHNFNPYPFQSPQPITQQPNSHNPLNQTLQLQNPQIYNLQPTYPHNPNPHNPPFSHIAPPTPPLYYIIPNPTTPQPTQPHNPQFTIPNLKLHNPQSYNSPQPNTPIIPNFTIHYLKPHNSQTHNLKPIILNPKLPNPQSPTTCNPKPHNIHFATLIPITQQLTTPKSTFYKPHNPQSINLPLQSYWDYKEAKHLKQHLSFKIGKAILF